MIKPILVRLLGFIINLFTFFYLSLFITDYSFLTNEAVSNISVFTGIFVFLVICFWAIDKNACRRLQIFKITEYLAKFKDIQLLTIAFIIIVFGLSIMGIARNTCLGTRAWDMGIFEQAFWNTLHGDIFFSSIRGNISLMSEHFEPVLFLLLPFYALKPSVATLVILQAILLGLSIFPLYLIAKDKLENRSMIFAFILSFMLSRSLRGVGLSDFHPEGFIVPVSFLAYYFLIKKRNLLLFFSCILLLSCKETAVFAIAGLGLYAFLFLKRRRCGAIMFLAAIAAWILETKIFLPFLNNYDNSYFYYERMPFGATYAENFKFVFSHFLQFLKFIFAPGKIDYILRLVGSLGFLPLFSPAHYVLIFMPLTTVLLASDRLSGYYSITSHYVAAIMPFVYISAIYGLGNIISFLRKSTKLPSPVIFKGAAIIIILASLFFYGKSDVYKLNKFLKGISSNQVYAKLAHASIIPKDASLSATSNFVPHLCHRKYIYDWTPWAELSLLTEYLLIDFDFQGDLKGASQEGIPDFIIKAKEKGYKVIFTGFNGNFFILRNYNYKKEAVEGFRGNIGL